MENFIINFNHAHSDLQKNEIKNYFIDDDKYGYAVEDEDDDFLPNIFEEDNEENDIYY